jgi:hypothetical protein
MGTLSKTAKASMVKEVKQARIETPEESLRQLRLDLGAGLYIPVHRIKVLLGAYDALLMCLPREVNKPENIYYKSGERDMEEAQRSEI